MSNILINHNLDNEWFHPTKLFFGKSILNNIDNIIKSNFPNIDKILIVTGKSHLKTNNHFKNSVKNLDEYDIKYFSDIDPYPSPDTVEIVSNVMKENKISLVIAVGGGSVMDASKAASLLSQNDGEWIDFSKGVKTIENKGIPLIAIPTTSGSSSEVTKFATIWDWNKSTSSGMNHPLLFPDIAIIDPELTMSMPKNLAATSGWDALTSSFESFWSNDSNDITDMYALKSISIFFENLENSVNKNIFESRENCALGATISGIGYSNSRPNLCHAIGTPLTLNWKITHGQAVCISLPFFLPYIFDKLSANKQKLLIETCKVSNIDSLVVKLKEMINNCGLETYINNIGINKSEIDLIVDQTPKERLLPLPINLSNTMLKKIISSMYKN